ncbi:hypothetical protein FRB99_008235 [Tulasnella sp. 403]|nr:hypothetical protein FRB99_008235 [Tulasnella sp. 403]
MSATTPAQPEPTTDAAAPQAQDAAVVPAAEPGGKVFVGNLTFTTDEAALRNFFASFADDILSVSIGQRFGRPAGYGFVTFKTDEAANNAIEELDKQELEGRSIVVEWAKPQEQKTAERRERRPKRKFHGRRGSKAVPGEATEPKGEGDASATEARIDDPQPNGDAPAKPRKRKSIRRRKPKTAATEGAADGANGDAEPAVNAPAAEGDATTKPERVRRPRQPRQPRRPRGEAPAGEPSKSVLFVANLAYSVDEVALTEFFAANGIAIKSARVIRRRWGTPRKSKGFAFVDVGDEDEQKKAIDATQGKMIADREVAIKIAVNSRHEEEAHGEGAEPAADDAAAPAEAAPAAEVAA